MIRILVARVTTLARILGDERPEGVAFDVGLVVQLEIKASTGVTGRGHPDESDSSSREVTKRLDWFSGCEEHGSRVPLAQSRLQQ